MECCLCPQVGQASSVQSREFAIWNTTLMVILLPNLTMRIRNLAKSKEISAISVNEKSNFVWIIHSFSFYLFCPSCYFYAFTSTLFCSFYPSFVFSQFNHEYRSASLSLSFFSSTSFLHCKILKRAIEMTTTKTKRINRTFLCFTIGRQRIESFRSILLSR